jgi:hypothetical protein
MEEGLSVETRARDENYLFQYACSYEAFEINQNNVGLCASAGKYYKMDTGNTEFTGNINIIPINGIYEVAVNTLLHLRTKSVNHQVLQSKML